MKFITIFSLLAAPALSQFCFNSEPVRNCAINVENAIRNNCAGNPQCACSESQRLAACYRPCESDPNFFDQIANVNAQATQYCNGGSFGRGPGFGGAFPSAIPGVWGGPSVQSVNINSGMFEATATFRSGNFNSRSFQNSGEKMIPALIIPVLLIITSAALI
ncbi:hypothetical protein CONCODRAFT_7759 [Conidiobolus coronatus NRRL 28638]|uniref:Extracellular membrane protein CFEM domain-containing protein n=1 Tax=Conidiobolus coronatus (strain ATCC 28846 / CBS 209.66 / NRRL 28638) TaxID=796925 RepID=A0A137P478_CONC2|nr:hypothetical protein CONCODRAFT_7759 [Conidiobolus coronatus NRRL 28638]|eukprot:KXN69749.1 hypothetical protein CONCODRAFT_7759 [Conidiobolus coronatus NRRL 28638]